jgi:hypothetical protein
MTRLLSAPTLAAVGLVAACSQGESLGEGGVRLVYRVSPRAAESVGRREALERDLEVLRYRLDPEEEWGP